MRINQEPKPNAVSSIHVKGGCGKTTILADLAIYTATRRGLKVMVVDTDRQGSMFHTLTGQDPKRYLPSERFGYWQDISKGVGARNGGTSLADANQRLYVVHSPVELFYDDPFTNKDTQVGLSEFLSEKAAQSDLVLVDTPPAHMVVDEIGIFRILAAEVDQFKFVVPSRPVEKEVEDGQFCYDSFVQLMKRAGISSRRVRPTQVLNFAPTMFPGGPNIYSHQGRLGDSEFHRYQIKKADQVILPSVPRQSIDMNKYSILLSDDIVAHPEWWGNMDEHADSPIVQDYIASMIFDDEGNNLIDHNKLEGMRFISYDVYFAGIQQLATLVINPKPENIRNLRKAEIEVAETT